MPLLPSPDIELSSLINPPQDDPLLQQILTAPPPEAPRSGNIDGIINLISGIMDDSRDASDILGVAAQINVRNTRAIADTAVLAQQALQGKLDARIAAQGAKDRSKESAQRQEANKLSLLFQGRLSEIKISQSEAATESSKASTKLTEEQTRNLKLENAAIEAKLKATPTIFQDVNFQMFERVSKLTEELRPQAMSVLIQLQKAEGMPLASKALNSLFVTDYLEITNESGNSEINKLGDVQLTKKGKEKLAETIISTLSNPLVFEDVIDGYVLEGVDPFFGIAQILETIELGDVGDKIDLYKRVIESYRKKGGKRKISNAGIEPHSIKPEFIEKFKAVSDFQRKTFQRSEQIRQSGGSEADVIAGLLSLGAESVFGAGVSLVQSLPVVGDLLTPKPILRPETQKAQDEFEAIFGAPR